MKKTTSHASLALLVSLLTAGTALATQNTVSVSGGGTLTYTYTNSTGSCEGRNGRSMVYYDITNFSDFSYTNPSGGVTQFPGATAQTIANSQCFPSKVTPDPLILGSSVASLSVSFVGNPESFGTGTAVLGVTGWVNPKYKIMGVVYTVPGEQSYVQYTDTTMMGTSTSTSSSFSTAVASSLEVCGGAGVGGNGTSICGTYSSSFTQESDTSSSFAVASRQASSINGTHSTDPSSIMAMMLFTFG
jgi:hypothetical protein